MSKKNLIIVILLIAVCAFLAFGATRAYYTANYEPKNKTDVDSFCGTYAVSGTRDLLVLIPHESKDLQGYSGKFVKYDENRNVIAKGWTKINTKGYVTLKGKDLHKSFGLLFRIKNKTYYTKNGKSVMPLDKQSDEAIVFNYKSLTDM